MGGIAPAQEAMAGLNSENMNSNAEREEYWRQVDNSVNAVSFGFVATAILISMFLLMAIFEKFLRSRSSSSPNSHRNNNIRTHLDLEHHNMVCLHPKLDHPSPKMSVYTRGVSVLMPGERIPTFIAHPAPTLQPCRREDMSLPFHQDSTSQSFSAFTSSSSNLRQI